VKPVPRGTPAGDGGGRPPRGRLDPYGLLPPGTPIAPLVSVIGLLLIAVLTVNVINGRLPFALGSSGGAGNGGDGGDVLRTPTPSDQVIVPTLPPEVKVPGQFVYAKAGNVWIQEGSYARQLTNSGRDSMPSFSPDGQSVYFIRTQERRGGWRPNSQSTVRSYFLTIPSLMRVRTDGQGDPTRLLTGNVSRPGGQTWFYWIREPMLGPDGHTVAMVSDGPDPTGSDVVLQFWDTATKKLSRANLSEVAPLGHQNPAWRPDGKALLVVRNNKDGTNGAPEIWWYSFSAKTARRLTGPGYLHPSWSRDQKWIAATKTTAFGTDVVVLDAATGAEVLRVTNDGRSWAPVFSPAGDGIAFLHSDGQIVDLHLAPLTGTGPGWTVGETIPLTELSGLDTFSRPGWFIPPDQLPALPTATPAPSFVAPSSVAPSPSG
jgi:dipeptidyl aminopeptidase/acylaminoacyl peptidase